MSLRDQAAAFARQGAAERLEIYGEPATYAGKEICVIMSAITKKRQIEAGGFEVLPDFTARVNTAAYPGLVFALGSFLFVRGCAYKIVMGAPSTLGGETKLELAQA